MNDLYLAKWPDGSVTLVSASGSYDLFQKLDSEDDPECCVIHKIIPDENDDVMINFTVKNNNIKSDGNLEWRDCGGKLKKIKLVP